MSVSPSEIADEVSLGARLGLLAVPVVAALATYAPVGLLYFIRRALLGQPVELTPAIFLLPFYGCYLVLVAWCASRKKKKAFYVPYGVVWAIALANAGGCAALLSGFHIDG